MLTNGNNAIVENPRRQLVENIQKWTTIDSQLKIVAEKTKKMREIRQDLTQHICDQIVGSNNLHTKIGISDGELKVYEKKEYSSITYVYLEKCLSELIPDRKQVEYIIKYLKDNREITTTYDIRRTYKEK